MANITKRAAKRLSNYLHKDEEVVAALLVEPKGTYSAGGVVAATLATRAATKTLEKRSQETTKHEGGIAEKFPNKAAVILLTNQRVLVSESNGLTFKEPSLELKPTELDILEESRKGLGKRLVFGFKDGTRLTVDVQRGQPVDAFKPVTRS